MIKSFIHLTDKEKQHLYEFIKEFVDPDMFFKTVEAFSENYAGPIFDHGVNHYSLWDDSEVKATVGLITKDLEARGEIQITAVNCRAAELSYLEMLLNDVIKKCAKYTAGSLQLVLRSTVSYLTPAVINCGFQQFDKALMMSYEKDLKVVTGKEQVGFDFATLSEENRDSFLEIYNQAFRHSPFGGQMTEEEMDNFFSERKGDPLVGLCTYQGIYVGVYELNCADKTGWIEGIGVHPDFQGRGIARVVLERCFGLFTEREVEAIKLIVIESNTPAYRLYEKYGFEVEQVMSTLFQYV